MIVLNKLQNQVHCGFFRWHQQDKGEDEDEVEKPDIVMIMKMWQDLAIERSRGIEKLQSKLNEAKFKLDEANLMLVDEMAKVAAEKKQVVAERSKLKLFIVLVVLSWAITTALIFSCVE